MASTDDMLCQVADALSDDDQIERLGKKLGFDVPQITRYIETNHVVRHVTSQGTRKMLRDWSEKVPTAETSTRLKTALTNSKLVKIAEIVEDGGRPRGIFPQLETEVNAFKKDLKHFYRLEFEEINTSPFDPENNKAIEDIYVNPLLKEQTRGKSKQFGYEEFIEILKHVDGKSRTILIGEAGVGKTTLLSKIAYDWAEGKHLKDIQLLLLVTLRENEGNDLFGDIFIRKLSDELTIEGERVDEYIRTNQRKVILLLDGLDDYRGDIITDKSAIAQVVRGEKFMRAHVVVTTRPWRAGDITEKMNKMYLKIDVKGFNAGGEEDYIKRFFTHEPARAQSLIGFLRANHVVAFNMAKFPIFCSMLCYVWMEEARPQEMKKLETFSQLIVEMMYSLIEHYCSKEKDRSGLLFKNCKEECERAFQQVGKMAFRGLEEKQLLFHDEDTTECAEALNTVIKIGVLSPKKIPTPRKVRRKTGEKYQKKMQFSHKLLQEYLAGCYVASLHQPDPAEFRRLLEQNVLVKYEEFKYFLYFLAAHDNGSGKTLMESLCRTVKDERFIMDVAFECHDENIIEPVVEYLRQRTCLTLQLDNRHGVLAFMYSLTAFIHKKQYEGTFPQVYETSVTDDDPIAFQCEGAMGLMTLPNMRSLEIKDLGIIPLHDSFYKGIINAGHHSLITSLSISDSSTMTSSKMGILLSLPCLESLNLDDICTDESDANRVHHTVSKLENLITSEVDLGTIHILGLLLMCPGVKQLILSKMGEVTCEQAEHSMIILKRSCRKLVELSITETILGNKGVCTILQTLTDHEHLKTVRIKDCGTDSALDSVCEEINRGGRMQVFLKHGQVSHKAEMPNAFRRIFESLAQGCSPQTRNLPES